MASITVYEIRTDCTTIEVHRGMDIKRFLDENVNDSAAFPAVDLEIIGEYSSEADALEALKAYQASAYVHRGTTQYEIVVTSYWVIAPEYELDENGERIDPLEEGNPIAFAPFRDDISLCFNRYSIFDWNGKEWVEQADDEE